ncbi:MAG: hypothetical protein HC849_09665 [Oscillatoriales cyanobacterium RU_3_3]|nr:hypothetical protein [Microcoleus sp. SU_5_6]NJL69201.1 hypothetical protein [Microcoleus sp. SM1_3_4]NJM60397.1 hypothetical protein [Oscillatoriales cyanobacterium RU_3_3]NJR23025.1 hypothetical protein [Richelia sp. CSU_2_1]
MNYEFSHQLTYSKLQVYEVHSRESVYLYITYLKSVVGGRSLSVSDRV